MEWFHSKHIKCFDFLFKGHNLQICEKFSLGSNHVDRKYVQNHDVIRFQDKISHYSIELQYENVLYIQCIIHYTWLCWFEHVTAFTILVKSKYCIVP